MVQRVGQQGVLFAEQCLEQACVRVETRRVQNGVVRSVEARDVRLKSFVGVLGPADEPHRGKPESVGVQRGLCSVNQRRTVGET